MSERFNEVRVLSARTDARGTSRLNQTGEGTILSEDPDTVHIYGNGWYGEWPVSETDIQAKRDAAIQRAKLAEEMEAQRSERLNRIGENLAEADFEYRFLIEKLADMGIDWKSEDGDQTVLIREDGSYLRLPTEEEAKMDYSELIEKKMVRGR